MTKPKAYETYQKVEEKAILIGVFCPDTPKKYSEPLWELSNLARTAEVEVLSVVTQTRQSIHPATYMGRGKIEHLKEISNKLGATLIIADDDLSPSQSKNLEKLLNRKVIDRTELILDIFARHAKSMEAKLQVELAQLTYALPRLKRLWEHLDRYEGGIGTRGPGEKQIETDKRIIKQKIKNLSEEIKKIRARKEREVLDRNERFLTVALVGYTNAGKSTLMNLLTNAGVLVEDRLFSTLDTRTRIWELEGRKILLSDTVGFIEKLPHHLVASFQATLEEARQSDLLLHVVDASSLDAEQQIEVVNQVLADIGLGSKNVLLVFNKIDAVIDRVDLSHLGSQYPQHVALSATQKTNIGALENQVLDFLEKNMVDLSLKLSPTDGKWMSWLEEYSRILRKTADDQNVYYQVRLTRANAEWITEKIKSEKEGRS